MIKPTVGRKVWYRPSEHDAKLGMVVSTSGNQPLDATVVYVHSDTCINLAILDHNGNPHARTSVILMQDDMGISPGASYAEWMPYQVGQAKKNEAELVPTVSV